MITPTYDDIQVIPESVLKTLETKKGLEDISNPFNIIEGLAGERLFSPQDIAFVNTSEFSKTAQYFLKNKVYTKAHPIYDKKEYDAFWDEEERRCREGITMPGRLLRDSSGKYYMQNIHITGEHYGYLNFSQMKMTKEKKIVGGVLESEDGELLNKVTKGADKLISFPYFWGSDYFYFKAKDIARNLGFHMVVGKARRKGYSYKNGWIAANRANLVRNSCTVLGAFVSDSLYPEGTMTMADTYLQFLNKHTDWKKRRLVNREDFVKFGYKFNDSLGIERGYLSRIICVSFGPNNPGAARGKDADLVMIEEAGKCPNLSDVLDSTLPTLRDGNLVTGQMIVFGTGGGEGKLWESFEQLFFAPSSENFMSFENIWDEDQKGTECGFFIPTEVNKVGFIDIHGNSDNQKAIEYEKAEREKRKKRGSSKLNGYIMEEPFCPTEAFSRKQDSILPIQQLAEQLKRVQRDESIKAVCKTGYIVNTSEGLRFKDRMFANAQEQSMMFDPITDYPIEAKTDVRGTIVMWAPPFRVDTAHGRIVPDNLYRAWHDPYAIPKEIKHITSKDSLGCTYIFERSNNITSGLGDRLVASFTGRRETTDQYNEILFQLLRYYNAKLLFENDRGDVFNYARQNKCLELLEDEPDILWKKALQGAKTGRKKGIHINEKRKEDGIIYYRDWLLTKRGVDENGKDLLNLHYIYDEALLKESIKWNMKGNFDRISTMIVGMFDIKEQYHVDVKKPTNNHAVGSQHIFDRELF